jgi:predicted RNA polymerase sigma factor
VARAYLLGKLGPELLNQADAAYRTAIGLSTQQKIRDYLEGARIKLGLL